MELDLRAFWIPWSLPLAVMGILNTKLILTGLKEQSMENYGRQSQVINTSCQWGWRSSQSSNDGDLGISEESCSSLPYMG